MLAPLRIQLLGDFRIQVGERAIAAEAWRLRAAALLVKLLALEPSHRLHHEQLMETIWPEALPEDAGRNLRYALHAARRVLAPVGTANGGYLQRTGQWLLLEPGDEGSVDVADFEAAALAARQSPDIERYAQALGLYGGDLLPGDRYEERFATRRFALRATYLALLAEFAVILRAEGRVDAAIDTLRRLLEAEPDNEAAHLALMELFVLRGEDQRALRQYDRLAEALRQVDAVPGAAARRLAGSIRPRQDEADLDVLAAGQAGGALALIVGRAAEQRQLRLALEATLAGRGRVVLVSGEAGIGKTALVEDLAGQAAARGCLVLRGHAYDLSVTPPYGPWLEIFRAYQPLARDLPPLPAFVESAEELARAGSQEQLFAAVAEFFAAVAARRPLLLVLEDLHWADQASLAFLRVLARQVATQRILIAVTYRTDEPRQHGLYPLLPLLVREAHAERLDVPPLDERGQRALVRGRYRLDEGDADRLERYLAAHAEGHPLFAQELLRTLEQERILRLEAARWRLGELARPRVPLLLRQVIEGRLARLDQATRQLLQIAAIIGQEVPLELWQQVAEAGDEALAVAVEQGQAAHLLEEAPGEALYRFRHALFRQVLYAELNVLRRRAWHRRAAEVLAAGARPDPEPVAYHYQQAGDPRAVDWLLQAGERARRAYAWLSAAERFQAALDGLAEHAVPPVERAILLYRIASTLRFSDRSRALALAEEARQLAAAAGEPGLAGHCQLLAGVLQCFLGEARTGVAVMEQGLVALDAIAPADLARLSARLKGISHEPAGLLAMWLAHAGRLTEARSRALAMLAEDHAPVLEPGLESTGYGNMLSALAIAEALLGRPHAARRAMRRSRGANRAIHHYAEVAAMCKEELDLVQLPYFPEELEQRALLAREGDDNRQRALRTGTLIPARSYALSLMVLEGNWAEAREIAVRTYDVPSWPTRPRGGRWLALLAGLQGDTALAWRIIDDLFPQGSSTAPGNLVIWAALPLQRLAAELALEAGELAAARDWLRAHDRWLDWSGAVLGRAEGTLLWARCYHAGGDHTPAHRQAGCALALASDPRQPLALIAVHRFLGQLETESRRLSAAEEHLGQSLELADVCAAPYERALSLLELASLRLAQAQPQQAREALAGARTICERLGAGPALRRVAALEEQLALTHTPRYPAGLTPREVEVLGLVAQGLTDAQVAERLFISRRTVSSHLASIYNKLGVSTRTAATRFVVEHHLS
ncbi:MAG TPA: AAA family ATPase [Nitrolancea sp.]|nr:AAA family ATPase [Nitrolancea sp.]